MGSLRRGRERMGDRMGMGASDAGRGGDKGSENVPSGVGQAKKKRKPQRRKIPGKSQREEYTQSSTQIREDRYLHILGFIRTDEDVREMIAQQCVRYRVEPGGGKPSYGYSELIEMLLVRWAQDEAGVPGP